MTARTARRGRPRPARAAFTLLEMLAVILIIATLIAIAVPSYNLVLVSAQYTAVRSEMAALHSAISDFKAKYGMEPPSYIDLRLASGQPVPASKAVLRKMFPQIDFTADASTGGVPGTAANMIPDVGESLVKAGVAKELKGVEALVFFLGGVRKASGATPAATDLELTGFSKNPANPFVQQASGQSSRNPYFYEFKTDRLIDLDGDGLLEYRDDLPGQSLPYLYLSTQRTGSYVADDVVEFVEAGWRPYTKTSALNSAFHNPNSYQLISPGSDGRYGKGGWYDPKNTAALDPADTDNLTNFASSRLGG